MVFSYVGKSLSPLRNFKKGKVTFLLSSNTTCGYKGYKPWRL